MTLAEEFCQRFENQSRNEDGFYSLSPKDFLTGLEEIHEAETDSYDPTITVTFNDGSWCAVGNPNQACYPAFIIVPEFELCSVCGQPTEFYKGDTVAAWYLCESCEGSPEAIAKGMIHG